MWIYFLLCLSFLTIVYLVYIIYSGIEPWRFIVDDYEIAFIPSTVDKRSTSISEEFVREIFQNYFQKPFVKTRPSWLIYQNGLPLELDGFNEELKLAFEYNGIQHYQFPNFFMKTYDEFQGQKEKDQYKLEMCEKMGVSLIVIPYTIKPYYVRKYVVNQIQQQLLWKSDK